MTKEKKSFYKIFFALYIALVCQNVITLSVNLMDNIMLGAYGESALSGVAAVNQVQFVFQQLIMALGDGLVILCSQYWGKKNVKAMKRIMAAAMRSAVVIAILLFIAASLCPVQILKIFSTDEEIIREGVRYLGIIRFTYLFFAITQILLASLRSTAVVKIASVLSLVTLGINCGINYVLIFGNFGFPRMGVEGAAIGTLTARVVEVVILVLYIWKKEKNIHLQVRDFFHMDSIMTKDYLKVTLPIAVLSGLWGLNTALQTVILGHMTSAAIAANSAASADICFDNRFATVVLRHFSSAAAAAHTNILDSSAETSGLMSFEMSKTNENISIHNGTSNSGGGAIFCIFYRNFNVICSAKSVTDNDLTACGNCVKSVQICTVHMFQSIFTTSWIKSITVGKKWHAPLFLTKIGYCFCVIRTQESQISKLSKMHFDGNKFTIHVNIFDPCCDT